MGQRANLIVVRDGDAKLYYDHWCANRLDAELFWGPELALEFIEARAPVSFDDGLLDEVWCEGAVVIDFDKKLLLWYGGEDLLFDVPLRDAYLDLLKGTWASWEVRWASGDIFDIGSYLDLPAERFAVRSQPNGGRFFENKEYPEDNSVLVSFEDERGDIRVARLCGDEETLLSGQSVLEVLGSDAFGSRISWSGEAPIAGVHFNPGRKRLSAWCARPFGLAQQRIGDAWPGWQVDWLGDRWLLHVELLSSSVLLDQRSQKELKGNLLAELARRTSHKYSNPARDLIDRISNGQPTQINPWTDEMRQSVESDRKSQIIRMVALSEGIPLPVKTES